MWNKGAKQFNWISRTRLFGSGNSSNWTPQIENPSWGQRLIKRSSDRRSELDCIIPEDRKQKPSLDTSTSYWSVAEQVVLSFTLLPLVKLYVYSYWNDNQEARKQNGLYCYMRACIYGWIVGLSTVALRVSIPFLCFIQHKHIAE